MSCFRSIIRRNKALDPCRADHRSQVASRSRSAFGLKRLSVRLGHAAGVLKRAVRLIRGRPNVGQDQVLQGLDPVSQGNAHFVAPSEDAEGFAPGSEEMRIARAVRAHRLSENRK